MEQCRTLPSSSSQLNPRLTGVMCKHRDEIGTNGKILGVLADVGRGDIPIRQSELTRPTFPTSPRILTCLIIWLC